jgi:predicted ATPase/transcriptional regulator with XRE-family HTH domain
MLDLSQEDLAERLHCAYETVRKIEAGSRRPSRAMAELLGQALAVPPADLPRFIDFARAQSSDGAIRDNDNLFLTPPAAHAPHNLPAQRTSFVGRQQELQALQERLLRPTCRLLTLTGPPGIGKTRLAVALAERVHDQFLDGVQFVPLDAVNDPADLLPAMAHALALRPAPGQALLDELKTYLVGKDLLLVLDNFEQITPAGGLVGDLIGAAAGLTVLVTSRNSLGVYGEQCYPVPSLTLPEPGPLAPYVVRQSEAVQLFLERAAAARPNFAMWDNEVPIVAEITRQLDGLPLAIELAAARAQVLRPGEILARLGDKLRLLARGPADLPPRQQTLRGAIAWSYDLLDATEQLLLQRLAVFTGKGGTREAIDRVVDLPPADLDDLLSSLLDKSLVRIEERADHAPRFWMLWTIREFAAERLAASGDERAVQARHAAYYLALTETIAPHLTGSERPPRLRELEAEDNNLRLALSWYLAAGERAAEGLHMAGLLDWYWYFRGHMAEGRDWITRALDATAAAPTAPPAADRGRALSAAGWQAVLLNDCQAAMPQLRLALDAWGAVSNTPEEALALARYGAGLVYCNQDEAGRPLLQEAVARLRALLPDPIAHWLLAFVLDMLADAEQGLGRPDQWRVCLLESLRAYQAVGDEWGIGQARAELGQVALMDREFATAQQHLEEAIVMVRQAGNHWMIALTLRSLGDAVLCQGDWARAGACYTESMALFQELGDRMRQAAVLRSLGHVARAEEQYELARHYYRRALLLGQEAGSEATVLWCLAGLAGLAVAEGVAERGAILFGAVTELMNQLHRPMPPTDEAEQGRYLVQAEALLGEVRLVAGLARGRMLSREAAVAFALSFLPDPAPWLADSPGGGELRPLTADVA